jgi:predicted small lipoprotein YifL
MRKVFMHALPLVLAVFAFSACGKKVPAPASQPAEAPAAVTADQPADEAPPATESPFAGSWSGQADPDRPLTFTVEGNQVTYFFANYGGQNGTCSYNGAFSSEGPSTINGKSFTAHGKTDNGPIEFNASGTFTSAGEASGTIVWKGNSGPCGNIDLKANWKAKKSAE